MRKPKNPGLRNGYDRFQVTSLGLLVMSGMINMIDRSTLSIANPLIRHDLGISIAQMGLLLSSFLWAYAFCQLPVGFFVDRLGPRLLLGTAQIIWSVAQLLCGFSRGFGTFCAMRMLLGAGESPQFPISARVVRDCFSPQDRGLPTGVFLLSSSIGPAIAAPLITLIMTVFWLARHVRHHGARRHCGRRHLALFLSFAGKTGFPDDRCALSRPDGKPTAPGHAHRIGASCLATAPAGG